MFVWLRRFESEEERERLYKAVCEYDQWKNYIGTNVPEMPDRSGMTVQRIVPTGASVLR